MRWDWTDWLMVGLISLLALLIIAWITLSIADYRAKHVPVVSAVVVDKRYRPASSTTTMIYTGKVMVPSTTQSREAWIVVSDVLGVDGEVRRLEYSIDPITWERLAPGDVWVPPGAQVGGVAW